MHPDTMLSQAIDYGVDAPPDPSRNCYPHMEAAKVSYKKGQYFETTNGNKVSADSYLCGDSNIIASSNTIIEPRSMIRGDLSTVKIGRYSCIGSSTIMRPPIKRLKSGAAYFPQTIGSYVQIGQQCVISASSIGDYVFIHDGCVVDERAVIKDGAVILPNSYIAPDTVVPPLAIFAGNPSRRVGDAPPTFAEIMTYIARTNYAAHVRE